MRTPLFQVVNVQPAKAELFTLFVNRRHKYASPLWLYTIYFSRGLRHYAFACVMGSLPAACSQSSESVAHAPARTAQRGGFFGRSFQVELAEIANASLNDAGASVRGGALPH
jgi:hypothetical protein